jgi:hypothetical protein
MRHFSTVVYTALLTPASVPCAAGLSQCSIQQAFYLFSDGDLEYLRSCMCGEVSRESNAAYKWSANIRGSVSDVLSGSCMPAALHRACAHLCCVLAVSTVPPQRNCQTICVEKIIRSVLQIINSAQDGVGHYLLPHMAVAHVCPASPACSVSKPG